jgi:hypothetical protein
MEENEVHINPTGNEVTHPLQLILVRAAWVTIVVPTFALLVVNIPAYFASLHHLHSSNTHPFTGQLTATAVHTLQSWGLSLDFYAFCMVGFSLLFQLSYAAVGVLIFWRKSGDRVGLLASFALMMLPFGYATLTLQNLLPGWSWLVNALIALGNISIMLCAYVFPDGQFVPRWTRWLALAMSVYWIALTFSPSRVLNSTWIGLALLLGLILSTIIIQAYRYRYASTQQQRQQTKWVVFGIALAVTGDVGSRLLCELVLLPLSHDSPLVNALEVILVTCSVLAIPPTLGIAILRTRLWDIDVVINRTLVYATLTTMLALVYFSLVITLQFLLRSIIHQTDDSHIAVIGSTLAIAALFQPLRHHLQMVIDRRFYRHKYDATRTLTAFSATLRHKVNLDQLQEQLVTVVEETMRPTHVSLWLRQSNHDEKPLTH